MAAYEWLKDGKPLLDAPHFVLRFFLGDAATGSKLRDEIRSALLRQALNLGGPALEQKVAEQSSLAASLRCLISVVPKEIPIAVLVDEYDYTVIQDVAERNWDAAEDAIKALREFFMAGKSVSRISRFLVTGVTKFAHTSIFSGANNFQDITHAPVTSRMMGFTEAEIRANFPAELGRLAANYNMTVDAALQQLTDMYNGYCFDGMTSCFTPFPVLQALYSKRFSSMGMAGATQRDWIGKHSLKILQDVTRKGEFVMVELPSVAAMSVADLKAGKADGRSLLLQVGLLSIVPAAPASTGEPPEKVTCHVPNESARTTLLQMLYAAVEHPLDTSALKPLHTALVQRSHAAFGTLMAETVEKCSYKLLHEAALHLVFLLHLNLLETSAGFKVRALPTTASGEADLVVEFDAKPGEVQLVWIIELGKNVSADRKLKQAEVCGLAQGSDKTVVCIAAVLREETASKMRSDETPQYRLMVKYHVGDDAACYCQPEHKHD